MAHVEELKKLTLTVLPSGVVALRHLPPAGDARPAGEELVASLAKLPGLCLGHGARANHGEVAGEHVQELRHLVEGGVAQEATDARHARVVVNLLLALPDLELLGVEVALGVVVRVGVHGAKLEDADGPAALPHALLAEDGAARGVEADGRADDGAGNQPHEARNAREDNVKGALHDPVAEATALGRGHARIGRRGDERGLGAHVLLGHRVLLAMVAC